MADLSGIRAKAERAQEHIAELQGIISGMNSEYACELVREFDPKTRLHTIRASGSPPPIPQRFRIIIGEAVQQLRSALDHLVCQLIIHECELKGLAVPDLDRRQFPIFHKENESLFKRMIQGVSPDAHTAIEDLQPYKFAGAPEEHFLFALSDLNNTDKHRLLLVVKPSLAKRGVAIGGSGYQHFMSLNYGPPVVPLEDGAILWQHVGDAKVQVDPKVAFDVAFPQIGLAKYQTIIPCLEQLRNVVVAIVDDFERRFF